jgi:hypothetical protein
MSVRHSAVALLFTLIVAGTLAANARWGTRAVRLYYGPGTDERLRLGFTNALKQSYRCVALGNSRMYRGLDPEQLKLPTYNFAHEDAFFNQCYFKLLFLERHDIHPDILLLNVDYFSFSSLPDSRNYIFADYFDPAYLNDFRAAHKATLLGWLWHKDFFQTYNENFNRWMTVHLSHGIPAILGCSFRFLRHQPLRAARYVKDNGQYVVMGAQAYSTDYIVRDSRRLAVQVRYFERILDYAAKHHMKVAMIMLPLRDGELKNYDTLEIRKIDAYIQSKMNSTVTYFNYSTSPLFTIDDYADITHLTPAGAKKFTLMLDNDLSKWLECS